MEKDTVVEEKTKANRVPGSSAGGAGQEELLRGEKRCADREEERCWVSPELTACASLGTGGDGHTGVTNRSLTTHRVQPQGLCTQGGWQD